MKRFGFFVSCTICILLIAACTSSPVVSSPQANQHIGETSRMTVSATSVASEKSDKAPKKQKLPPLRIESEIDIEQMITQTNEIVRDLMGIGPFLDAPPSPTVRPFGDNKFWVTLEVIEYEIGSTSEVIEIPAGFVTDFASIPEKLWSLGLSPHGQYSRAALIHDFLYWAQPCTREQADRILVIAMKESMVASFDEVAIYFGVFLGGDTAWSTNRAERLKELPRIVPNEYLRPKDPNLSWPNYRDYLVTLGVKDPPLEVNPSYCHHGNSTTVP